MPITDNTFSQEEFDAAIAANPELLNGVKASLGTRKFIVHDETEHSSYLKTIVEPKIIADANKKFHDNLEKDVKELTGEDKATPDEKSYVYLKRVVGAKLGTLKQMEDELKKLKEGHSPSAADKARIQELEQGIVAKENEWNNKLKEKDTEINNIKATGVVNSEIAALRSKFKDNLPKTMVDTFEKTVLGNIIKMVRFTDEGKIVLYDGDTLLTNKDTLLPLTLAEKLTQDFGDIIDTGKPGKGSGTKEDEINEPEKGKFTSVPADVKTKTQLSAYLLKLGYVDGSDEFDKILDEHGKNLPLR